MRSLRFDPFDEFQEYLSKIQFGEVLQSAEYVKNSRALHRRMLSLLVIEDNFSSLLQTEDHALKEATKRYALEVRSDSLAALMIFHFGLSKAAFMSLRSAIENLLRVALGAQGIDFRDVRNVYSLIDMVKDSGIYLNIHFFKHCIDNLTERYRDYCGYVHSGADGYLSQERHLGSFPSWDERTGARCSASMQKTLQFLVCTLIAINPSCLRQLRHDIQDSVLDSLPMRLKSQIASLDAS
jgi:hypothetical protein